MEYNTERRALKEVKKENTKQKRQGVKNPPKNEKK